MALSESVMMKNFLNTKFIVAAAVAGAIFSAAIFLSVPSQLATNAAMAQNEPEQNESSSQNQTDTMMPPTGPIVNPSNGTIVLRGTVSSMSDPSDPTFNTVDLLPPNMDGYIYSGTLTFTSSKKVLVGIYEPYEVTNSSAINPSFGEPFNFPVDEQGHKIAISVITPQYGTFAGPAATIPFVGSGVTVATLDSEPFVITYAISATATKPQVYNEVSSAMLGNVTAPHTILQNQASIVEGAFELGNKAFSPNPLMIGVGEKVTWTNNDFMQHTVTSGTGFGDPASGDEFTSLLISPSGTFEHTFEHEGEFDYYCQIHPNMVGKVIVQ